MVTSTAASEHRKDSSQKCALYLPIIVRFLAPKTFKISISVPALGGLGLKKKKKKKKKRYPLCLETPLSTGPFPSPSRHPFPLCAHTHTHTHTQRQPQTSQMSVWNMEVWQMVTMLQFTALNQPAHTHTHRFLIKPYHNKTWYCRYVKLSLHDCTVYDPDRDSLALSTLCLWESDLTQGEWRRMKTHIKQPDQPETRFMVCGGQMLTAVLTLTFPIINVSRPRFVGRRRTWSSGIERKPRNIWETFICYVQTSELEHTAPLTH